MKKFILKQVEINIQLDILIDDYMQALDLKGKLINK